MKVRISIEVELPDVKDDKVDLNSEYVPGISWKMAHVIQSVFDNILNYAIVKHLDDAMKWLHEKKSSNGLLISKQHSAWAEILRKAEPTMKVEEIK